MRVSPMHILAADLNWAPEALIVVGFVFMGAAACYLFCRAHRAGKIERMMAERTADRDRFWELSPDMMCVADFTGIILRVNPAVERVLGYRPEDLVGRPFMDLVYPDDLDNTLADLAEAAAGKRVFESINRFRAKDGRFLWLTWNSQPILAEQRFYAVGHDVTDRIIAEERQKAQDEALDRISRLHEAILASSDYTIVTTGPDGRITTFNAAAERMFGYSAAEVIDRLTPLSFHMPQELAREARRLSDRIGRPVNAGFEVFIAGTSLDQPYDREWTFTRKDGSTFPALLSVTALRGGVGQLTGLLGIARDITQLKAHEAELQQSLEKFRSLAELAPVGIYLTDADGSAIYVNEQWTKLAGVSAERAMGVGWLAALHPDDRQPMHQTWRETVEHGGRFESEFRYVHADGATLDMITTATPLRDAEGNLAGYLGTCVDITAEKAARQVLERRVDERTKELTATNRRLEGEAAERRDAERRAAQLRDQLMHVARLSTMGELAAGLAHELNQPLGAIANYTQGCARLIESGSDDRRALIDTLAKVADQAHRAGQIIHRLRALVSRRESDRKPIDVRDMIAEVAELLDHDARHAVVRVALDLADDLPPVHADRIQVQQVLLNLMRNAIEAMSAIDEADRLLTVTAASCDDGAQVAIEVADSGPGCSDEQLRLMFDAFYTTKAAGMGLGLSISRTIVETHGGRLEVRRNDSGGLTFRFALPTGEPNHDGQGTQVSQATGT